MLLNFFFWILLNLFFADDISSNIGRVRITKASIRMRRFFKAISDIQSQAFLFLIRQIFEEISSAKNTWGRIGDMIQQEKVFIAFASSVVIIIPNNNFIVHTEIALPMWNSISLLITSFLITRAGVLLIFFSSRFWSKCSLTSLQPTSLSMSIFAFGVKSLKLIRYLFTESIELWDYNSSLWYTHNTKVYNHWQWCQYWMSFILRACNFILNWNVRIWKAVFHFTNFLTIYWFTRSLVWRIDK